ncbi:MAG TPA: hypothetical protein VIY56_19635 [Vicinamibacterales bacterium]
MTRGVGATALRATCVIAAIVWAVSSVARAQLEDAFFDAADHPAIAYATSPTSNAVTRLAQAIGSGERRLDFAPGHGYLRSLLQALDVPEASQVAVFSKTSLQARVIAPANPRAIFFNDSTIVAWPSAGFIEIATQDPRQGAMFYVLEQRADARPQFQRPASCLTCHVSYATLNVPGLLIRSVATGPGGQTLPHVWNGTTSHRTPLAERWAGWYVTGGSGQSAHLGNVATPLDTPGDKAPTAQPSTWPTFGERVPGFRYLSTHSDIAALLVFDHQMHLMNLLTRLGWEVRVALADQPATAAAVATRGAVDVVDYMLFVDEAPLAGPVGGDSGFSAGFTARGPRDKAGRSLRQLDLTTRLQTYPCSYLIYSAAFEALPEAARQAVYARLWRVLSGSETTARYTRRTRAERLAIVEILRDTKPDLPAYFREAVT